MAVEILRAELDSNPGLYGSMTDAQVVTELLAENKTTWLSLSNSAILNAIDVGELNAKTAIELQRLMLATQPDIVETAPGSLAREIIIDLFAAGTNTRNALIALAQKTDDTRAAQIGITPTWITEDRVGQARAL